MMVDESLMLILCSRWCLLFFLYSFMLQLSIFFTIAFISPYIFFPRQSRHSGKQRVLYKVDLPFIISFFFGRYRRRKDAGLSVVIRQMDGQKQGREQERDKREIDDVYNISASNHGG